MGLTKEEEKPILDIGICYWPTKQTLIRITPRDFTVNGKVDEQFASGARSKFKMVVFSPISL